MKKNKGQFGYRNSTKKLRLIIIGIFAAAIIAQLLARNLTDSKAAKNILTVMAILTVLPMANMASPLLAVWKYKTPKMEFYQKISGYEASFPVLYDLILTSKDNIMPMDAIAIHPNAVIAYCSNPRIDTKKAETFLNDMLKNNKLDPNAKVISDERAFMRRLDNLKPASEYKDDGSREYVIALMKSLSV